MSALRRDAASPLWRLLTILVAVGQLLVVGASCIDAAAGGRDERTHVEASGTRQHYVHNDAACEFCALQHLAGVPFLARPRLAASAPAVVAPPAPEQRPASGDHALTTRSRAPPSNV